MFGLLVGGPVEDVPQITAQFQPVFQLRR